MASLAAEKEWSERVMDRGLRPHECFCTGGGCPTCPMRKRGNFNDFLNGKIPDGFRKKRPDVPVRGDK